MTVKQNQSALQAPDGSYYVTVTDGAGNLTPVTGTTTTASLAAAATGGYTYKYIPAGTATTVVKASAGTLHSITFNSPATSTNTTTIYDNASGAGLVIGIPAVTSITFPETVIYDIAFTLGLTIITATANGGDMTVAYK